MDTRYDLQRALNVALTGRASDVRYNSTASSHLLYGTYLPLQTSSTLQQPYRSQGTVYSASQAISAVPLPQYRRDGALVYNYSTTVPVYPVQYLSQTHYDYASIADHTSAQQSAVARCSLPRLRRSIDRGDPMDQPFIIPPPESPYWGQLYGTSAAPLGVQAPTGGAAYSLVEAGSTPSKMTPDLPRPAYSAPERSPSPSMSESSLSSRASPNSTHSLLSPSPPSSPTSAPSLSLDRVVAPSPPPISGPKSASVTELMCPFMRTFWHTARGSTIPVPVPAEEAVDPLIVAFQFNAGASTLDVADDPDESVMPWLVDDGAELSAAFAATAVDRPRVESPRAASGPDTRRKRDDTDAGGKKSPKRRRNAKAAAKSKRDKVFQCKTCRKWFDRPSALATHMHAHTGLRPHKCPVPDCRRWFSVRSNARRHSKTCVLRDLAGDECDTDTAPPSSAFTFSPQGNAPSMTGSSAQQSYSAPSPKRVRWSDEEDSYASRSCDASPLSTPAVATFPTLPCTARYLPSISSFDGGRSTLSGALGD